MVVLVGAPVIAHTDCDWESHTIMCHRPIHMMPIKDFRRQKNYQNRTGQVLIQKSNKDICSEERDRRKEFQTITNDLKLNGSTREKH